MSCIYNFSCHHESDPCCAVLVSTPSKESIELCNASYKTSLYKTVVNVDRLLEQHANLVKILRQEGIYVIDLTPMISESDIHSIPKEYMGNLVFTRDPILCTPQGLVFGKFKETIRQYEITILKNTLNLGTLPPMIEGGNSIVEGGDYIPLGNTTLIANGNRTNLEGIFELMLRDLLITDMVCIVHYPPDSNMHAIHLDCYVGIVGNKHAVIWDEACTRASVSIYHKNKKGVYIPLSHTTPLGTFLEICGFTLIPVSRACQESYGCNLLDLGNNTVLTQDIYVTNQLKELGYNAIYIPFDEVHKMYGGIRCATQILHRKKMFQ